MPDKSKILSRTQERYSDQTARASKRRRESHIWEKHPDGWYVEPSWCIERLLAVESFNSDVILDPACGWGTITNAAQAAGYKVIGTDIVDRGWHSLGRSFSKLNFLLEAPRNLPRPFSVVCNPDFKFVRQFCERALGIGARKVAMICLVRRLPAAHWLRRLPLQAIYLLTPRPSMPPGPYLEAGNKPEGGWEDFCWLIFCRGYDGAPTMRWLHRDEGETLHETRRISCDAKQKRAEKRKQK